MAARVDPLHASARHQSLHHFVAKAEWSDAEMLRRICQWVVPRMDFSHGGWWIIDDTGFPKKGKHSVGVARQYCGVLGKQDNCQVAVSVSLACEQGSIPVAWQLYLPEEWATDTTRRAKAGVPEAVEFATKPQRLHKPERRSRILRKLELQCDATVGIARAVRQFPSRIAREAVLPRIGGLTFATEVGPADRHATADGLGCALAGGRQPEQVIAPFGHIGQQLAAMQRQRRCRPGRANQHNRQALEFSFPQRCHRGSLNRPRARVAHARSASPPPAR
jgi:hypothetical protein